MFMEECSDRRVAFIGQTLRWEGLSTFVAEGIDYVMVCRGRRQAAVRQELKLDVKREPYKLSIGKEKRHQNGGLLKTDI